MLGDGDCNGGWVVLEWEPAGRPVRCTVALWKRASGATIDAGTARPGTLSPLVPETRGAPTAVHLFEARRQSARPGRNDDAVGFDHKLCDENSNHQSHVRVISAQVSLSIETNALMGAFLSARSGASSRSERGRLTALPVKFLLNRARGLHRHRVHAIFAVLLLNCATIAQR